MRRGAFWVFAAALTTATTLGAMVACDGCNATPAQVESTLTDIADATVCVLSSVFAGVTDPAQLVACGPLTPKLVAQIIDDALQPRASGDAGLGSIPPPYSSQQLQQLRAARLRIVTALASQAGGK